ncbi:MAG: twin-arginine translocase TatA/TatE family subunit [Alphaproteobacteria bacterium]|nr:twin-arginine translocase TatA/TatE family subunit [Alphaproteobacteria bacterium]
MGSFSIWHWLVVLLVILLLFGGNKISGLMGDLAKGIKSFKANIKDEEKDAAMAQAGQPAAAAPPAGNIAGPQGATTTATEAQPAAAAGATPAAAPSPTRPAA